MVVNPKFNLDIYKICISVVFLIFACLFYWVQQYWVSFATLLAILIAGRIDDVQRVSASREGIIVQFNKINREVNEIVRSHESIQEKIHATQKLIDEIFRLGYVAAGGNRFRNIWDVHIERDKDGNITRYEYSEN